ncbi:galactose-3-O-sulfotransferase 2-like [Branchiostoma lanceolatum]|uniref:galactose-3-O-sulfotransferase 2-like n=1 Tax=Branchiostoma lanceolatum TaxID=7740 RepID=UPI0034567A4E
MAVRARVKVLWSVFLCLSSLLLVMNFSGAMWGKLDMGTLSLSSWQQQHVHQQNSSDAVLGRGDRLLTSELSVPQRNDTCMDPVTNFVFIKVHKTASASTAVVLLRFAYKHHMIMCYPRTSWGIAGFRLTFPSTEIYKSNCSRSKVFGDHFNFLVHHTVFNKTAMDAIMKPGTKYIGIMREPQSHIRSWFFYNRHHRIYKNQGHKNPLGEYLDNPEYFEDLASKRTRRTDIGVHDRNKQAFIMGFPPDLLNTQDTGIMDRAIWQLHQWYTFVIISEYYEESLVMLRRKMCWDLYDILHSTKKIHEQHTPKKYIPFTDKQLANHKRINALDYRMYDFFNRTLWKSVEEEERGKGFWEEVAYFKALVERVNTYCLTPKNERPMEVPSSKWNKPFSVTDGFCKGLSRTPKEWARRLFYQMARRDKIWKKSSLVVA